MNNNLGKDTLKWLRTYGYCLNSEGEKSRKLKEYIKEHYFEQISTEDVAKAAGVSIYHLCRCFKEVTGMTVIRYINYIRCCAARAMLMKGERTVSETARECGFSGLSYFTKTYASFIGCTPMQTLKNGE